MGKHEKSRGLECITVGFYVTKGKSHVAKTEVDEAWRPTHTRYTSHEEAVQAGQLWACHKVVKKFVGSHRRSFA